jgi:hypothetical protein
MVETLFRSIIDLLQKFGVIWNYIQLLYLFLNQKHLFSEYSLFLSSTGNSAKTMALLE